jgi:hypothetical protein
MENDFVQIDTENVSKALKTYFVQQLRVTHGSHILADR